MSDIYFDELDGYFRYTDGDELVHEHTLNALLDHEPEEVFDPDNTVHHCNTQKLDNRAFNLDIVERSEHDLIHKDGVWVDVDGEKQLRKGYEDITDY